MCTRKKKEMTIHQIKMKNFLLKVLGYGFEISLGVSLISSVYIFLTNIHKFLAMNLDFVNWFEINGVTSLVVEQIILILLIILLWIMIIRLLKERKLANTEVTE